MNIIKRAWQWLTTKQETKMSDQSVTDTTVATDATTATVDTTAAASTADTSTTDATTVAAADTTTDDASTDTSVASDSSAASGTLAEIDPFVSRLKKLVAAAGTSAHHVFDELVELALKIEHPGNLLK